ncbi:TonB-dependent receptor [Paraflavisolibacter sp. H34]|uniref:SusC/RagA family TonB-linked outer membrane protein n=1 Tax=Huijunlia imazamoxiresistens TaxID=3127457 RepID=UPI003018F5F8
MTITPLKAGISLLVLFLLVPFLLPLTAGAQEHNSFVKGVVKGPQGEPLPGASVILRHDRSKFTLGTKTDSIGVFTFSRVPAGGPYSIAFSIVGYESQTLSGYTLREGTTFTLAVDMKAAAGTLDQVVVIGYGAVKKSNLTGAVTSVKPEELKKVPASNVMEAIQGKVPGVDITRSSGSAGAKANVSVRGNRSLTASNQPLYIVDGIQYTNFEDLNPNDIQSMEVLKDAASTAIYGSRGANGVIIINTKKGKTGQPRISVNTYAGTSEIYGYPDVQSPEEFKHFRREANRTTGKWNGPADDAALFGNLQNSPGVVWKDYLIHKGAQQDVQVGVSAGSEKTNFYASLDYFKEKGLFKNDQLNRYSVRVNADYTLSKKLKVGTQNQLTYYLQDSRRDALGASNGLNPLELPYDSAGHLVPLLNNGRSVNPLMEEVEGNYVNNNRTSRLFNSAYLEYTPLKHLMFRSNLGVTVTNSRDGLYAGSYTTERNGAKPLSRYVNGNNANFNLENVLNYTRNFDDHALTLTAVQSYLVNRAELITGQGTNQLLAYQSFYGLANANEEVATSTAFIKSSLVSAAGRIQYGYKEKYLLMLTGRSDGASQLSPGRKWAFFPSASAAWRLIKEDFMLNQNAFSDLKLRLSYGVAGNSAVSPYSTQSNLVRVPFAFDESPAIGYTFSSRIGNDDLQWELSTTYNAGLDFGLLKNRISGTVDVFQTRTKNLLLERLLPLTSGVSSIIENVGRTRNLGVELGLNASVINQGAFRWNINASWWKVKEEIMALATSSNDVANGWFIGQPTQAFYDYQKTGIWQTADSALARTYGQAVGDIRVRDVSGADGKADGRIDATSDRVILGSVRPKWSGNLTNDFKFKNFDLSFQVFARWGQMMKYDFTGSYDPSANTNSLSHVYWTPENPTNEFPRPNANKTQASTLYYSTLFYKDGSFAKLRNATLGYTFSKDLLQQLRLSSLRVYLTARNLYTYSKVKNYDPERGGSVSNPMTRLFVAGVNLDF